VQRPQYKRPEIPVPEFWMTIKPVGRRISQTGVVHDLNVSVVGTAAQIIQGKAVSTPSVAAIKCAARFRSFFIAVLSSVV